MDDIPIYYNGEAYTVWEAPQPNALCSLFITDIEETYSQVSIPTRETHMTSTLPKEGIYYRWVSCLLDTGKNKTIDLGFFQLYMNPPPDEPEEEPEIPEEIPKEEIKEPEKQITKGYMPKDNTVFDTPEVLGRKTEAEENICYISLLRKEKYEIKEWRCYLGIQVSSILHSNTNSNYLIQVQGTYLEDIYASIKVYECESFFLLDPQTWFKCKERLIDWFKTDLKLIYKGKNILFNNGIFSINSTNTKDISGKKFAYPFQIYFSHKRNEWIDIMYEYTLYVDIPEAKSIENRLFTFPLDRYIGVTQWYGCTAYQCPHAGIDFGARLNNVLSTGDGTVYKVGYDKYGGECNQGGNYIIVKHTNGMYSVYFHLERYSVKAGDNVKKGELIGISGNSGKWNCQNLGYHLHFETRKNSNQSSHTNPVPLIDADWSIIPTLGKDTYPQRLTGDNPHPNY